MPNATPSRLAQVNAAGAADALFIEKFVGEILTAFDEKNIMMGRHRVRNVQGTDTATFANTGRAVGRYHTPGALIKGQSIKHNETKITIDDLLISDAFIANIDEAKNHYEVRGEYSSQLGKALARTFDKSVLRAGILAARAANKISDLPDGTQVGLGGAGAWDALSNADRAIALADALFVAHQNLVEKDVDTEGAFAVVTPADYFALVQNKDLLNTDWGGLGSYARAELPMVAGLPIVVSNHLPAQDDTAAAQDADGNRLDNGDVLGMTVQADFSATKALVMTPEACGTVKLMDLALEHEYQIQRQGTLFVAKMAVGHGVLRPECAVELHTVGV